MHAAQPSLAAVPLRSSAGTRSAALAVADGIATVFAEHARALRATDVAALSRRQLAVLRALYCGGQRPFS